MKNSRGQSSLEYLVTYGWAILAIVIIAAALWYFGVFNPSKYVGDKQSGGFASFNVIDFSRAAGGSTTLILGNKQGNTLTFNASANFYCTPTGGSTVSGTCTPASLAPNAQTTCTCTLPSSTSGNSYDQVDSKVFFTDSRSTLAHTDTGFFKGKIE